VNLHPTRATVHVALAGATLVGLGLAARAPAVLAFGGAMVLAVAIGRAAALVTVTRLRAAGFEMVWGTPQRVMRLPRGSSAVLVAELRNRGLEDMRGVGLRALASSLLEVDVTPKSIDLPAGARVQVDVHVRALRVGRWGVHGVALEVRGTPAGGEGLYEAPLMFANPFGIEVFPRPLHALVQSPRGGRARRSAEAGSPSRIAGEGEELRELREHVPGDPFKRIAWKASARRGQLLVRDMEREERDVVWLVVDASVELWAGVPGHAPLDHAVEEAAALATRHLERGDRVGLIVTAARTRAYIPPEAGAAHGVKIAAALASAASMIDDDRTELDELEVAQRVSEHARPLDPAGLADIPRGSLDALTARADQLRKRAPFAPRLPHARSPREQHLRLYLAAFGVEVPPRADGERDKTEASIAALLDKLTREKPRASIVHVFAPAPSGASGVVKSVANLKRRRAEVRWSLPVFELGANAPEREPVGPSAQAVARADAAGGGDGHDGGAAGSDAVAAAVGEAVLLRTRASRRRGERALRRMGVVVRPAREKFARNP
jgi:uncharacterized protein (DUF58 family)